LRLREHRFPRRDVIEILHAGIDPLGERLDRETIEEIDRLTRRYEISGGPSATVLQAIPRIESHRAESADGIRHYARIVASIERDLAPPPGPLPARRWAELLERISSGFPVETETDLAALSAIDQARETLDRYERAGALLHPQDLVQILESLGDLPDPAPPPETLPRIWFGDVMRLRGRLFDHLFLIAAEEGTFPQGRNPDALLADQERKRLGISEIGDGIDEERLLLQLTLDSSHQSLQASFAWSDDAGRAKRPSHFLQDLALERDPERSALILGNFREYVGDLRVFGPAELAAGRITRVPLTASVLASPTGDGGQPEPASGPLRRKLRLLAATGSGSIFDGYLMPGDELREAILQKMQQIPPTHLEDFGECPQRFFFKRVLGVRELEDPDHEIEIASRRKGSLRHEILEAFYRDLPEEETRAYTGGALPSALSRRLSALIEQKFQQYDRDYPAWNPLIRKIEREVTERALHRFVAEDLAEMNESGFRPRHFEYRFGAWPGSGQPPVTLRFGGVEMSLHGSIDRIDQGEDGALRVVDYKSGRAQHLKDLSDLIEAGRGLQLPLYALAAAIAFGLPDEGITAVIKPLDRKDDLERFGFALSSKRAALERVLGFFVNRAIEGIFPAFPGEKICRFCPVNQSCRSRHDAGERAAAERFQNVLDLLGGSDAEA
ncbi:MAG TPA: PD-(D/E)XK nuclease family protein, partial [Thermoanaerobaculia bacterium]|nr:PD-(D/E)XK nuclease family protein [Thermoanaerobaculia bacterium]